MANYFLTNKAVADLTEIWHYTYEAWSERQADIYYKLLTSSFLKILSNPATGKPYKEIDAGLFGLRVGKHIVFYKTRKAGNIDIVRILHQKMDLKRKMEE